MPKFLEWAAVQQVRGATPLGPPVNGGRNVYQRQGRTFNVPGWRGFVLSEPPPEFCRSRPRSRYAGQFRFNFQKTITNAIFYARKFSQQKI
jgi:hypothetical protein